MQSSSQSDRWHRIVARLRTGWKYANPLSPYRRISRKDRAAFTRPLAVWRPSAGPDLAFLRWQLTRWCNYDCPYCPQNHRRDAAIGEHFTAHAFDNYEVDAWIGAFRRHFAKRHVTLVLTGGEPMLDRRSMPRLLQELVEMPTVACVRIDTNAAWSPRPYAGIDRSKLILMCTFHPSQVAEGEFLKRVDSYIEEGFRVGLVNYVITHDSFADFERRWELFRQRGIPLHPNPLWRQQGCYGPQELELLRRYLPSDLDYRYRALRESPQGNRCLFPALSYEMDPAGKIHVGCHREVEGSFFDRKLPRPFAGPVPCPMQKCSCLDMYSFLEGSDRVLGRNPLEAYGRELLALNPRSDSSAVEHRVGLGPGPSQHQQRAGRPID